MDLTRRDLLKLSALAPAFALGTSALPGCSDSDGTSHAEADDSSGITLITPGQENRIYSDSGIIWIRFDQPLDPFTVSAKSVSLSDKDGLYTGLYEVLFSPGDASGKTLILVLKDGFHLEESWLYYVTVTPALRNRDGISVAFEDTNVEVLTTPKHPFKNSETASARGLFSASATKRTQIIVISDLHLNTQVAVDEGYSWFSKNKELLEDFLEHVQQSVTIAELIIAGDLLDNWLLPMAEEPWDTAVGITSNYDYFESVINAPTNQRIIQLINQIAAEGNIKVSYVNGNHDMLLDETIFRALFPNVIWQVNYEGGGIYEVDDHVVCTHGHQFGLFCAPNPHPSSPLPSGSILPPGYFVTRASATKDKDGIYKEKLPHDCLCCENPPLEPFYDSYNMTFCYHFHIDHHDMHKVTITCNGIDGFNQGTHDLFFWRDLYHSLNHTGDWKKRQEYNGLKHTETETSSLINASHMLKWFHGADTLYDSAYYEYLTHGKKIAIFGHTHLGMLVGKGETAGGDNILISPGIYANAGTWINDVHSGFPHNSFICIDSATLSESDVYTVTLYSYKGEGDMEQIKQHSIKR
jgi:UDP-2,3-diacylglucosamine pyrophosphatase LpxH